MKENQEKARTWRTTGMLAAAALIVFSTTGAATFALPNEDSATGPTPTHASAPMAKHHEASELADLLGDLGAFEDAPCCQCNAPLGVGCSCGPVCRSDCPPGQEPLCLCLVLTCSCGCGA